MARMSKIKVVKSVPDAQSSVRYLRRGCTAMPVVATPRHEGAFPNRITRQIERIRARRGAENVASGAKEQDRHGAQQDRLYRQADREKSGFYEGTMALANVIGERFGRMRRQKGEQGGLVRLG